MALENAHDHGLLRRCWEQVASSQTPHPSLAHEQALIRLGLALGVRLRRALSLRAAGLVERESIRVVATSYPVLSLGVVGNVVGHPASSLSRHIIAQVIDVAVLTCILTSGDKLATHRYRKRAPETGSGGCDTKPVEFSDPTREPHRWLGANA